MSIKTTLAEKSWVTKTASWLAIAYAIMGYFTGLHDINTAVYTALAAMGGMGVGRKVDRVVKDSNDKISKAQIDELIRSIQQSNTDKLPK